MPEPETIRPVLDDAYWFAYSKEMVERTISSRNEQAGRFQTFVVWLWGIYTASAAVGLTLGSKNLPWYATLAIALPSFFLIVAYWSAVKAQTPPYVRFDPRSPTEIMAAYDEGVRQKENLLWRARAWSFVAAFCIGVALVTASLARPLEKPTAKEVITPKFSFERKGDLLTVWGRGVDCKNVVAISAFPADSPSAKPIKNLVLCVSNGEFATEFDAKPESEWKHVLLKVEWTDKEQFSHMMSREIK